MPHWEALEMSFYPFIFFESVQRAITIKSIEIKCHRDFEKIDTVWRFRFEKHHWLSKCVAEFILVLLNGMLSIIISYFKCRGLFRDSVRHFLNTIHYYHFLSFNSHFFLHMCEFGLFSESALLKITKYQF